MNNGKIKLAEVKNDQIKSKSNLGEIKKGKNKSKNQNATKCYNYAVHNIEVLYKARNEAIKLFDDYSLMASEAKNKGKNESRGLKILTPKQML